MNSHLVHKKKPMNTQHVYSNFMHNFTHSSSLLYLKGRHTILNTKVTQRCRNTRLNF